MTNHRVRQCDCGTILMPGNPALVCSFECLAAEFGGSLPRSDIKLRHMSEATRAKLAAQAKAQAEGFNAIVPPSAVVTDFPSRYAEIVRHWEKRDEGLIDPATLPSEDDPAAWPHAVSQAQVYWARRQLQKAKSGAPVPQSTEELYDFGMNQVHSKSCMVGFPGCHANTRLRGQQTYAHCALRIHIRGSGEHTA
jgi:hypothetical protein